MPDGPIIAVSEVAGSSSSDDGLTVIIGFKTQNGEAFNLAMPHERAIDLIMYAALVAGQAGRNRDKDPGSRGTYVFPAASYRVDPPNPDGTVHLHLGLPNGPELSFRFDIAGATRLYEGLGSVLGLNIPSIPAGTRPN